MVMKGERVSWQKAIREHGDTGCLFMAKAGLVQMSDHGGSGTGCCAPQRMTSWASGAAPNAQRTSRWHQRSLNASRVSCGSRPRSQSLSTPAVCLMVTVASRQSPRRAVLHEESTLAATAPADGWASGWCRMRW